MKLIDILNEKRGIPENNKVDISILKEYIFKDWQVYNQKLIPSFKHLRSNVLKESYSNISARNNVSNVVDFAAKKYVSEKTDRKYMWNEVFSKGNRINLTSQLVEFFEKYNLNEDFTLITEQESTERKSRINFSDIEVEINSNNQPILVINFNYDEETQSYITNVIGKNQVVNLSETDMQLIQNSLRVQIKDISSGQKMSYVKFSIGASLISRADLKHLVSGAFLNRPVTLQVGESQVPIEEPEQDTTEVPIEEPTQPEVQQEPIPDDVVSKKELREIVKQSIKDILGE